MKTKVYLLITLVVFCMFKLSAQTTADTGIAIQGIARDANNTARILTPISLTVKLYYFDGAQEVDIIAPQPANLTTDGFGVFSYILEVNPINNPKIANNRAYLRISEGSSIISDKPLQYTPYAIAASNGVPTGSIMPYIGDIAPIGWVLCDGSSLPTDGSADALITLVGNNAPDLRAMFLRGAGDREGDINSANKGPDVMTIQEDEIKEHLHGSGTLVTDEEGEHNHNNPGPSASPNNNRQTNFNQLLAKSLTPFFGQNGDGNSTVSSPDQGGLGTEPNLLGTRPMISNGDHTHTVLGETALAGAQETRPISYGVNYIIKL